MPAATGWKPVLLSSRVRQRGFSLLEIMVAVALLALIIVGLLAMFYQVQRAFRSGTAQVDVMERGRAGTSMIVRETQEAIAVQLEGITNMAVVLPVVDLNNNPAPVTAAQQALPGGETRQNFLRDFFFLSRMNDEWVGTAYRISNAVSGVGTLYRLVERQTTNNPWFFASNFAIATPYNNTNFRRVMDGVVHFTVELYDTNGWFILPANNAYPSALGYAVTNGMLPAYVDVELAVLEPIPLEKFRYRYDVNTVQAGTYLANQAARTHVFRQRVPIRPASADYGQ
jgi:prepilin-type N-terminal cleavage/methylation domain-containing protein